MQQLSRWFYHRCTALIGGAGLFDVIHVVFFSCDLCTAPNSLLSSAKLTQRFGVCLFWTVRYRSQAAAGTFFLGRPPFAPFARAAATLAGVFALPPFAPILDAAQFAEPNSPSSKAGK